MEVKCYICDSVLDVIFSLDTPKGKPAFLAQRKFPLGFSVYTGVGAVRVFEVESVEKHEWAGWIHYLKEL